MGRFDWSCFPENILFEIFLHLEVYEISKVSQVCRFWHKVSSDDLLWKKYFQRDFHVSPSMPIAPGKESWKSEYKRLVEEVVIVETEVFDDHENQVLHISFSHDGEWFATCSKDGYVHVWTSEYPATLTFFEDMRRYSWRNTQFSQFNSSDTLLLVSGVHFGDITCASGEIAIFNLEKDFQLQCRVQNKPYDIFGCWYNDTYLLSGDLMWLPQLGSASLIWLNKSKQEVSSEHEAIINRIFKFYNCNASTIRSLIVSKCLTTQEEFESAIKKDSNLHSDEKHKKMEFKSESGDNSKYACPSTSSNMENINNDLNNSSIQQDVICRQCHSFRGMKYPPPVTLQNDEDKYLIFTTGTKTYSPHQIGFKRIPKFDIPTKMKVNIDINERLQKLERLREMTDSGIIPGWQNPDQIASQFDKIDHLIDLDGYIIGMALSPDHRYLYVNCRPWPKNYIIENPLAVPIISQEFDIHIIDLVTLEKVGKLLRSNNAFTPSNNCFFIFLDVSYEYVASGAEDKHGYIWDRYYEICLAKLPHKDVVNAVAFNPTDPEMLITVSDDSLIKVWRSRRRARELSIDLSTMKFGKQMKRQNKY